jgi:KUP system potassium uptake protein
MEKPDTRRALGLLRRGGFPVDLSETSFFIGREERSSKERSGIRLPVEQLFILLSKLSLRAMDFLGIPLDRIAGLGGAIEI